MADSRSRYSQLGYPNAKIPRYGYRESQNDLKTGVDIRIAALPNETDEKQEPTSIFPLRALDVHVVLACTPTLGLFHSTFHPRHPATFFYNLGATSRDMDKDVTFLPRY